MFPSPQATSDNLSFAERLFPLLQDVQARFQQQQSVVETVHQFAHAPVFPAPQVRFLGQLYLVPFVGDAAILVFSFRHRNSATSVPKKQSVK